MRRSIKCLLLYFFLSTILLNIYFFSQVHHEQEDFMELQQFINKENNNEFLILDWTGKQHIFQEQDPIKCDFSRITPDYCRLKFTSILNNTLRLYLIERCYRLTTLTVRWTADQSHLKQADLLAYHSLHMPWNNLPKLIRNDQQQQFSIVYILESEVHSSNGQYWQKMDFAMWYNLQRSYPEPATYFNLKIYLDYLFAPIRIPFSNKTTTAPIIWIISNCGAYNGRQVFIKQLMSHIRIDSYGKCLHNIEFNTIKKNSLLYSSYKFVIAIENSNCEDYVTEKLIQAFASTAIPIVASRNGKPDYTRFAPRYSYINIYDYKSIKHLADYLNYLSNNETAYNEYLWFRRLPANKYSSLGFIERSLTDNLHLADEILGVNATMCQWLLTKETSVNKYCKLTQFIYTNYWKTIDTREKLNRPTASEVCLPRNDLAYHFLDTSVMNLKRLFKFNLF